jgi:hypothetical protein
VGGSEMLIFGYLESKDRQTRQTPLTANYLDLLIWNFSEQDKTRRREPDGGFKGFK